MERAVCRQLEGYLVKKNLLYEFQSGFRGIFSTETCLTYLTDYIKTQTSKGLYTRMIMLDLQNAFDNIGGWWGGGGEGGGLKAMGVKSVDWFK